MGNSFSFVPPYPRGSVVCVIESGEPCNNETCPCQGREWDVAMRKPAFVDLSAGEWEHFVTTMDTLVRRFKPEGVAAFGLLGILVGIVFFHPSIGVLKSAFPTFTIGLMLMMAFTIGGIVVMVSGQASMRKANMAIDEEINALCQRTSTSQCTFNYVHLFTQTCKPKGARTYRAVVITPGGGGMSLNLGAMGMVGGGIPMGMMANGVPAPGVVPGAPVSTGVPVAQAQVAPVAHTTVMRVTCPPQSRAGDQIQIIGPSGTPLQVTVPNGIAGGEAFDVQVPAAAPPPVVQAVAVPIGP